MAQRTAIDGESPRICWIAVAEDLDTCHTNAVAANELRLRRGLYTQETGGGAEGALPTTRKTTDIGEVNIDEGTGRIISLQSEEVDKLLSDPSEHLCPTHVHIGQGERSEDVTTEGAIERIEDVDRVENFPQHIWLAHDSTRP